MATPPLTGVLETCIYVDDIERSRAFYQEVLGLKTMTHERRICTLDVAPGQVLIIFQRGGTLKPVPVGDSFIPPHDATGPQHFAFAIPADSYEAWKEHLAGHGCAIESEVTWPPGGKSLYFRDPDGLLVELATPGLWKNY